MLGWAPRRDWRARSRHAQVEASLRWSLLGLPWFMGLAGVPQALIHVTGKPLPAALAWSIVGCTVAACGISSFTLRRALDSYVGSRPAPRAPLAALTVLLAALIALTTAMVAIDGLREEAAEGMILFSAVGVVMAPYALLQSVRRVGLALAGATAVAVAALGAVGRNWQDLLGTAAIMTIAGAAMLFSARCSGWYMAVLRELEEARDTQARLAVAEERLRFARDLHDVMGRNLSVIALKSELAVQLARRGADTAEDQMVEVQRIARESQREVRDVVRGYREADLSTELAGAGGILRAAGIECRVPGDGAVAARLPDPVRSALGWVVREGTTNVLRHAHATRCTVTLRVAGAAVLTMENDGAGAARAADAAGAVGDGSGLAGLRERLAALGGTLTAEPSTPSAFRLTAEIPLTATTGSPPALHRPRAGSGKDTPDAVTPAHEDAPPEAGAAPGPPGAQTEARGGSAHRASTDATVSGGTATRPHPEAGDDTLNPVTPASKDMPPEAGAALHRPRAGSGKDTPDAVTPAGGGTPPEAPPGSRAEADGGAGETDSARAAGESTRAVGGGTAEHQASDGGGPAGRDVRTGKGA